MLTSTAPDVWVRSSPLRMLGLEVGTRMTVVRLPSGDLLVHSPIALDDALASAIDALGPVRHVVAPNLYHHLFAAPMLARYPDARLFAPPKLAKKNQALHIHEPLGPQTRAWEDAVHSVPIRGTLLQETVLVHAPSRTLISADLLENFETSSHWPTRMYLKAFGIHGKIGVSYPLKLTFRKRDLARRDIDQLLEHDLERIVVAHGDVITEDAKPALRQSYAWLK